MTTILVKPTTKRAAIERIITLEKENTTKAKLKTKREYFITETRPLIFFLDARYKVATKAPAPAEETKKPKVWELPCKISEAKTGSNTGNVRAKKLIRDTRRSNSLTGL